MRSLVCLLFLLMTGAGCATTRSARWVPKVAIAVSMDGGQPSGEDWTKINLVMQPAIESLGYRFTTERSQADVVVMLEYTPPQFPGTRGELVIGRILKNDDRLSGAALARTQRDMIAGIESAMARR